MNWGWGIGHGGWGIGHGELGIGELGIGYWALVYLITNN